MAHIKITLDTRRVKQDKTYPLVFRVSHRGESRDIPTGLYLQKIHWNKNTGISKSHMTYNEYSTRIRELESVYLIKIIEFEKKNRGLYTVQQLKDFLTEKTESPGTVLSYWKSEIRELQQSKRFGNADVNYIALSAISKFIDLNIPFERLDYSTVKYIESKMLNKGLKINSIGVYFRALRTVYNSAINKKLVSREHYPFDAYKIKRGDTTPRVMSICDVHNYFNKDLKPSDLVYESWLIGKLMFLLQGINFTDLVTARHTSIIQGRFIYTRSKTKKMYSVKLVPETMEILEYFIAKRGYTILGLLSEKDIRSEHRLTDIIRQKNKVYNSHIKKIGVAIKCSVKLTGYTFRYTYSNIAKKLGYSKDLIAEALGHEYGNKVTGIYLEHYDLEHIDKMLEDIVDKVINQNNNQQVA